MKKRWWLVVGSVVVLAVILLGYRVLSNAKNSAQAQVAPETVVVQRGTLLITVEGSGSLVPHQEVEVPFQAGGRVTEILVQTGDAVKAGDILARVDGTDAQRSLADAKLAVQQSQVSLSSAQLSLDDLLSWTPDENAVASAQASLAAANQAYQEALKKASLSNDQLTSSSVNLAQAQRALDNAVAAYNTAFDPGRDWELGNPRLSAQIQAERNSAQDNLVSAQDSLKVAQAAYDLDAASVGDSGVASARSQVVSAQQGLDSATQSPDDSEIKNARLQVEQAQVSLQQAQLSLTSAQQGVADTEVLAPIDGTISEMDLTLGQMVSNGQMAANLVDLSTLEVQIGLDESDIAQVSVGQPAKVTLDAFDGVEIPGAVAHIAPMPTSQSGVVLYDVTVALDATDVALRLGMTADVEVVTASATDALIVPLKAVQTVSGESYVARQTAGGGFEMVPVKLGLVTDTSAEILEGLQENDVVVIPSSTASQNGSVPRGGFGMVVGRKGG